MRKTIFLTILLALLSVVAIQAQTIKNSSIAVQPTLDNTVPFSFNPIFRYDTTSMILYVYDDGEWTILADGSTGGGGSTTSLSADSVTYDPSGSVLVSTDAQAAIDELALNQGILDSYYAGLKCDSTTIVQAADTTYTVFTCYKSGAVVQRDTVWSKLGTVGGTQDATEVALNPAIDVDGDLSNETTVQEAIEDMNTVMVLERANLSDLTTAVGIAPTEQDLGTFTGSTITDNSTVKDALQELETGLENVSGGADGDGIYDGPTSKHVPAATRAVTADSAGIVWYADEMEIKAPVQTHIKSYLNMNSNRIGGVADPVSATDAVNLQTLQSYSGGASYTMSDSAPSDTTAIWIDTTNAIYLNYPVKQYYSGSWSTVRYWDVLTQKFYEDAPEDWGLEGQSNAIGGAGSSGGDREIDSLVHAWNGTAWVIADLDDPPFRGSSYNNYCFHAARARARETGVIQRIVIEAFAGRPISDWVPSSSSRYISFENKVNNSGVADAGGIDFWTFFQGESDNSQTITDYKADCDTLVANLRAEDWFGEDVPLVFVAMLDGPGTGIGRKMSQVHRTWANDSDPYTFSVLSGDLTQYYHTDNVHLNAEGLKIVGQRVANVVAGRDQQKWYYEQFPDSTVLCASYQENMTFRVNKTDTTSINLNHLYFVEGGRYSLILDAPDSISISMDNATIVDQLETSYNSIMLAPGFHNFYYYRDTFMFPTTLTGGAPPVSSDTMSASITTPYQFANVATGQWRSTDPLNWEGYAVWDQYSPSGTETLIEIEVNVAFDSRVMLAFDTSPTLSKWNGGNAWDYGVYYNGTTFITMEGGTTTTRSGAFAFGAGEKMGMRRSAGGTVTAEYFDGTSWTVIHTFGTDSSDLYFHISTQTQNYTAQNPDCTGCATR